MMKTMIWMEAVMITRQLLLLFYFYFFHHHFIIPLGIFYSMSADINSFEIEVKYEIHLCNFLPLLFSIINRGLYTQLSTGFFSQYNVDKEKEKEMKIEVEGGIDFIIKRRKNEIATDFDLQSDRANKTVHKTISFCFFSLSVSLSLFINRKLCNAIIFLMALKSICI